MPELSISVLVATLATLLLVALLVWACYPRRLDTGADVNAASQGDGYSPGEIKLDLILLSDWELDDLNDNEIVCLGKYVPKRYGEEHISHRWTQTILAIKKRNKKAIQRVAKRLSRLVSPRVMLAVVPGHDPDEPESGMMLVVQALAEGKKYEDASYLLVRLTKVPKRAYGGHRDDASLEESIWVMDSGPLKDRGIVLLDDVTTTEGSLRICRKKLLAAGARRVKMVALGRTRTQESGSESG